MTNVVPLKAGGSVAAIIPRTVEEVFRLATAISKSGLAPKGMSSVVQCTVAIMTGAELGLPPMQSVQRIAVINGRPCVWGDAIPALLLSRGFRMQEDVADECATCTITRPDGQTVTRQFSKADAMKAGLWGKSGPWQQYPSRMLQMRARGFASRDGAADVLAGLYIAEEAADIIDVTPARKSSAAAKRDGDDARLNAIRAAIEECTTPEQLREIRAAHDDDWKSMPGRWADLIHDDWSLKIQDNADACLRAIQADAESDAIAAGQKWSEVIMALPEAERLQAVDMVTPEGDA